MPSASRLWPVVWALLPPWARRRVDARSPERVVRAISGLVLVNLKPCGDVFAPFVVGPESTEVACGLIVAAHRHALVVLARPAVSAVVHLPASTLACLPRLAPGCGDGEWATVCRDVVHGRAVVPVPGWVLVMVFC